MDEINLKNFPQDIATTSNVTKDTKVLIANGVDTYVTTLSAISKLLGVNSEKVESVSPGELPYLNTKNNRYMEVTETGDYYFEGVLLANNPRGYITIFWWDGDSWSLQSQYRVMGDSVEDVTVNENGDLIITYTDGVIANAGYVKGDKGDPLPYSEWSAEDVDKLIEDVNINAQRIPAITAGVLPTPPQPNMYMVVTGVGAYTYGGVTIGTNTEGHQTTFWWDGTVWSLNDTVALPSVDLSNYVTKDDISVTYEEDVTGTVTDGVRPRSTTGVIEPTSGYKCSDFIEMKSGDKFQVDGYSFSSLSALIVTYDESKNRVSDINRGTGTAQYFDNYIFEPSFNGFFIVTGRDGSVYKCAARKEVTGEKYAEKLETATKDEVNSKQDKNDATLNTESKDVVGAINELKEITDDFFEDKYENIPVTPISGFYKYDDGVLTTGSYRSSQKIDIDSVYYLINGSNSSAQTALIVEWDDIGNYLGFKERGIGSVIMFTDYVYTPSPNAKTFATVAITSDVSRLSVRKYVGKTPKSYTKTESDDRYVQKSSDSDNAVYGIKFDPTVTGYSAERTFDAVGLSATAKIGTAGGVTDFANKYPWSEMKRVNIKVLSTGAKKYTYFGESGFTTDGINGDVFLEVPISRWQDFIDSDGKRNIAVSKNVGDVHPAFIEDGKIVDKIYIACYESSLQGGEIVSRAGAMPLNNMQPQDMLNLAKSKGYSLYDHRTVDLMLKLMWIEFGTINFPVVFGNGWSDMIQPDATPAKTAILSENNTNRIVLDATVYNTTSLLANFKERAFPGSNITICKGSHQNIIANRKVVSVTSDATQLIVTFDGIPIDIDTTCYFGSAPQDTGMVDTLGYHTGRTVRAKVDANSTVLDIRKNPNVYWYIENMCGNVWHYLPDVTFENGVPYVSLNMKDYEFWKKTGSYKPVAIQMPAQEVNEGDNWLLTFTYDHLCKYLYGQTFGVGNYNLRSGAYYYMKHSPAVCTVNGGGFDHRERCNPATNRDWIESTTSNVAWYLYGCRLIYKNI